MNRPLALLVALTLILFAFRTEAASLPFTDVVFTGTLTVQPSVAGGKPTKVSLTKKTLLAYFGFSGVNPASVIFDFEPDNRPTINIGLSSRTTLGAYGGLITFNTNNLFTVITPDGSSFTQYGSANFLNEQFTGTITLTGHTVTTKKKSTQTLSITFAGTGSTVGDSSPNAILRGTLRGTYTQSNSP